VRLQKTQTLLEFSALNIHHLNTNLTLWASINMSQVQRITHLRRRNIFLGIGKNNQNQERELYTLLKCFTMKEIFLTRKLLETVRLFGHLILSIMDQFYKIKQMGKEH